jgi:hypothetical protein
MVRTQIYLSEPEKKGIEKLARASSRTQSELIREAIGDYLQRHTLASKRKALREAAGIWKDYPQIGESLAAARNEIEQRPSIHGYGSGIVNEE